MKKYFFTFLLFGLMTWSPCLVAFGDGGEIVWHYAVSEDGTKGKATPLNNDSGGKSIAGGCNKERIGKPCSKTGVQEGICVNVAKKGDTVKPSCAAKICDTGYLLELYSNGKSKGICRTEQFAKDQCKSVLKKLGETCDDGTEAVPRLMKNPNNSSDTRAYKECFCANKNMVTYKCGEGASGTPPTDSTTYTNIQNVTIKENTGCTKTGSTFTKWKCGDRMYDPGGIINIENGITCVAQWDTNEYTVTFDWGAGATEVVEYTYGTYVTLPGVGNHTKDGHTFSGWTKEGENFASGQSVSVSGDATYVAQWKKCDACNPGKGCNCELKVESNKCTYVTTPQSGYNITDGQNTNAPQCVLVRKQDCESAGGVWSGNGCKCNPDVPNAYFDIVNKTCVCIDSKKVFNKARTLCEDPEQELVTHNITFNLNGGTGCEDNTYIVGEDNPVDCQPTKSGYKVAGWTMSANNQTTLIPMPYIIPDTANSNITFTVEWEKVITCPESDNMPPECDCSGEKIYNSSTNTCDCPSNKPADASGNCVEPKRCPSDSVGTYPKCRCNDTDKKYDRNKNECVIDELKKAYDDARAKEQSKENRMLTAATTAATGLGGMELARGFSEQQADKNARNDMLGYVSTFRCEYGKGNNVMGGPDEVQLPVIDLTNNKTKYKELAESIKVRKAALGMKPGLESEEILERTTLYDEENIGITGSSLEEGSIYRAEVLKSESDAEKLKNASSATDRRIKGGAAALGGGIVGGVVGNQMINGKQSKADTKGLVENTKKLSKSSTELLRKNHTGTVLSTANTNKLLQDDSSEEETPEGAAFQINGFCFSSVSFDLHEHETCGKLTKRGTWWISSSFGNIEGEARCGKASEQKNITLVELGQIPCFCKITSINNTKIADAEWVKTASYRPKDKLDEYDDVFCESNCAHYCYDSLFKHKRPGNAYEGLRNSLKKLKEENNIS